jgi:hypothetical protein
VTPGITPLDQWLSGATRGLSAESAARVRAEIQQHYDSACEAGDNALAALGDPRAANRAYRKVLLTEQEAIMAPVLTQPKRRNLPGILISSVLLAPFVWTMAGKHHGPGVLPIMIAIFSTLPLAWIFPQTTLQRTRIYLYVQLVRDIVVVAIAWWYQGWISALAVGAILVLLDYFLAHWRLSIFRKLAAGQTYGLLPGEPQLTHLDAIWMNTLRKRGGAAEYVSIAVIFLILAGETVWLPATFVPLATWIAASLVARLTLPIYTEERSRWYRIAKWTIMAVVAVLPVLYGARIPWMGAAHLAFFFAVFDMRSISLRRKLPAAQWPKRLYW